MKNFSFVDKLFFKIIEILFMVLNVSTIVLWYYGLCPLWVAIVCSLFMVPFDVFEILRLRFVIKSNKNK